METVLTLNFGMFVNCTMVTEDGHTVSRISLLLAFLSFLPLSFSSSLFHGLTVGHKAARGTK